MAHKTFAEKLNEILFGLADDFVDWLDKMFGLFDRKEK